jgi:hypothetical protein
MIGSLVGQVLSSLVTANIASAGAAKLQRSGRRVAWFVAAAMAMGLLAAATIGCFGAALWYALEPKIGPAGAAAFTGVAFAILAGIIWLLCRTWYLEPRTNLKVDAAPNLTASLPSALPSVEDLGLLLERHAGTATLIAFAVGLLAGRRK